jgi:hypothetical protein
MSLGIGLLGVTAAVVGGWTLAGGSMPLSAADLFSLGTSVGSEGRGAAAQLQIASEPAFATAFVDGQKRGQTPITLALSTGSHNLRLTNPTAVDNERVADLSGDTQLDIAMLMRRPTAVQLKSPYPGSSIDSADFLPDGRVALAIAEPVQSEPGPVNKRTQDEAWIFDPSSGSLTPFSTPSNPRSAIVAVSPDGKHLAYARPSPNAAPSSSQYLTDVAVVDAHGSTQSTVFALQSSATTLPPGSSVATDIEEVHDIAWTPDGRYLLVTVRLAGLAGEYSAASRSRLILVDPTSEVPGHEQTSELLTLPAEIVKGSFTWAPDGKWVAFLTGASRGSGGNKFVSVCALDTSASGAVTGFRYIADLGQSTGPAGPLPAAPVSWSPTADGRLLYVGPTPKLTVSNPLGLPTTSGGDSGLFLATPTGPGLTAEEGQRVGSATGLMTPAWLSGEQTGGTGVLALSRSTQGSRPLIVRGIDPMSGALTNLDVVLPPTVGRSGGVAAKWDPAHGRALLLTRHDSSGTSSLDFWLVQIWGEQ